MRHSLSESGFDLLMAVQSSNIVITFTYYVTYA